MKRKLCKTLSLLLSTTIMLNLALSPVLAEDVGNSISTNEPMQSATEFPGGIKAYNDTEATSSFFYGDIITIKVSPRAIIETPNLTKIATTTKQMALFVDEKQLTEPQNVQYKEELSFEIDTRKKDLTIGNNTITAKYLDSDDMADYNEEISITLNKKAISATIDSGDTSASRDYDGTCSFKNVKLLITSGELIGSDSVNAKTSGTTDNANVGTSKIFTAASIVLDGEFKDWYSLAAADVAGNVAITAKDVTAIPEDENRALLLGIATFVEPVFDGVGKEKITGTISYSYEGKTSYNEIVSELAKLKENDTADVSFTFTANGNYSGTITSKLKMTVVYLQFEGIDTALIVKPTPVYGDNWESILKYDASKLSAIWEGIKLPGVFTLTVNSDAFESTDIPTAGKQMYAISFSASGDNTLENVLLLSDDVTVEQREAKLDWSILDLRYNNSTQIPTASIKNKVNGDDVTVSMTGEQTDVGNDYIVTASGLTGTASPNYKLSTKASTTFDIFPAVPSGNATIFVDDNNKNEKFDNGDTVTADISNISPLGSTINYEWKKTLGGTTVNVGSNQNTYIMTEDDTNGEIFCDLNFSANATGQKQSNKLEIANELLTGTITITGKASIGSTLELSAPSNEEITGEHYSIVWYRDNDAIANAAAISYTLTKNDLGKTIKAVITAKEGSNGFTGSLASNEVAVSAEVPEKPVLLGTAGKSYIRLNWKKPFENGSAITGYKLIVKQDEKQIAGSPFILPANATSYNVEKLAKRKEYSFELIANNAAGSAKSDVIILMTVH